MKLAHLVRVRLREANPVRCQFVHPSPSGVLANNGSNVLVGGGLSIGSILNGHATLIATGADSAPAVVTLGL